MDVKVALTYLIQENKYHLKSYCFLFSKRLSKCYQISELVKTILEARVVFCLFLLV